MFLSRVTFTLATLIQSINNVQNTNIDELFRQIARRITTSGFGREAELIGLLGIKIN